MKQVLLPNHIYHINDKRVREVQVDIITFAERKVYEKVFGGLQYSKYPHRKVRTVVPVKNGEFIVSVAKDKMTLCFADVELIQNSSNVSNTLSFLVITRDSEKYIDTVLGQADKFKPSEIVVCINDKTTDKTEKVVRKYTDKVFLLKFNKPFVEDVLDEAYRKCSCDWIFRLDDDELISANIMHVQDKIVGHASGYWFPRYHCINDVKHYIYTAPWYPDWQLRLFKRREILSQPDIAHQPPTVHGSLIKWSDCHIFHMTYLRRSKMDREKRWNEYASPDENLKPLQLYEDYELMWKNKIKEIAENPFSVPNIPRHTIQKDHIDSIDFKLVQIQTTSSCPARCLICGYKNSWMLNNKGVMNDKIYTKILKNIDKIDPSFDSQFCPYLMNEPFSDPKIIERTKEAFTTLYNPFIEISSNLLLLNKKKIQEIIELYEKFEFRGRFIISHFGIDKESFERSMKLPYEKCLNNMIELINAFDGQIKIRINNFGISRDNHITIFMQDQIDSYFHNLITAYSLPTKNLNIPHMTFHNRAGNVRMDGWAGSERKVRDIDKNNPFDCFRIHNCLHVFWNGEITLCCMDYKHEEVFGDLNKQTIEEVFNSKQWKDIYGRVIGTVKSKFNFICKYCQSPGG